MAFREFTDITPVQRVIRWQQVLRVIQSLTPHERKKHFDMSDWGKVTDCGTVACAAGHCGLDPWFRRRGFQLNFHMTWYGEKASNAFSDEFRPEEFFGVRGAKAVFYRSRTGYAGTIRNIKNHIAYLERQAKRAARVTG